MSSDDVGAMTQKEMLVQLYQWKKESIENDARLRADLDGLNKRLDRQEGVFEKISTELSEQRNFFAALENLGKKLSELGKKTEEIVDWRHEQEKLNLLEQRDNKTIDEKFDRQEESFEKISEELISQRNFFTAIESMNEKFSSWDKKFSDMGKKLAEIIEWKHEQEKLNLLEQRDNKAIDEKFDRLFGWKDKASGRLDALENKSATTTFALVKKIGGIVLTMIVTAITAYLIGRIK